MNFDNLRAINEQNKETLLEEKRHTDMQVANIQLQKIIVSSFQSLVDYLDNKVTKAEVINQLQSIGTPDVAYVVKAVESLHETIQNKEDVDLSEITGLIREMVAETKAIPKELPEIEIPEQKFVDYSDKFEQLATTIKAVEQAVKDQKTTVEAPIVNIPETVVNVPETDLKPIEKGLEKVKSAVESIELPKTDVSGVEKRLDKSNKLLKEIVEKPVGGGGGGGSSWTAVNEAGIAQPLQLNADDELATSDATAQAILQQIEANTEAMQALCIVMKTLQQATVNPPYIDKSANAIRNQVQSGTVTTVTTVTNLTNFGTQAADVTYRINSLTAWANSVRRTIS